MLVSRYIPYSSSSLLILVHTHISITIPANQLHHPPQLKQKSFSILRPQKISHTDGSLQATVHSAVSFIKQILHFPSRGKTSHLPAHPERQPKVHAHPRNRQEEKNTTILGIQCVCGKEKEEGWMIQDSIRSRPFSQRRHKSCLLEPQKASSGLPNPTAFSEQWSRSTLHTVLSKLLWLWVLYTFVGAHRCL